MGEERPQKKTYLHQAVPFRKTITALRREEQSGRDSTNVGEKGTIMPATPKSEDDWLNLPSLQERLEKQRKKDQARRQRYYAAHREGRLARQKEYYALHKEERNAYSNKYHKEHREELEAYQKEYRAGHREEQKARNREYYLTHQQSMQAWQRRYHRTHREEGKKWKAARTKALWDEISRIYGDSCSCCGTKTRYFLTIHHVRGRKP
jgi:DNA gyrase/topoisomerase IV subunit A